MRYRTAAGLGEQISDLGIWIRAWTAGLCTVLRSKVAAWPSMWESNERSLLSPPHKKRPVSLDKEWTSFSFLHRYTWSVDCSEHCCTDNNGRRCHWQTLLQIFLVLSDVGSPLNLYFNASSWLPTFRFIAKPELFPIVFRNAAVKDVIRFYLVYLFCILCSSV